MPATSESGQAPGPGDHPAELGVVDAEDLGLGLHPGRARGAPGLDRVEVLALDEARHDELAHVVEQRGGRRLGRQAALGRRA